MTHRFAARVVVCARHAKSRREDRVHMHQRSLTPQQSTAIEWKVFMRCCKHIFALRKRHMASIGVASRGRCWLLELPVKHVLQYHHVENCMRVSTLQNILSMASSNAIGGAHACIIFEYACASGTGRLRSTMWLRKQSRLRQC